MIALIVWRYDVRGIPYIMLIIYIISEVLYRPIHFC